MIYLAGVVVFVGLTAAVLVVARKVLRKSQFDVSQTGLTLVDARDLRARGVMTEEEFNQVKQVLVGSAAPPPGGVNRPSAL